MYVNTVVCGQTHTNVDTASEAYKTSTMDTNGEKNKNKSEYAENIKTFENIDLQDGLEYVVC